MGVPGANSSMQARPSTARSSVAIVPANAAVAAAINAVRKGAPTATEALKASAPPASPNQAQKDAVNKDILQKIKAVRAHAFV